MMENRFTGPRAGSVATSFGSLIHAVAETASNEGLDAADCAMTCRFRNASARCGTV